MKEGNIQSLISDATSESLLSPDIQLNKACINAINSRSDQTQLAIKHFKSRLTSRNPKIQLLTLNLLDSVVKSCDLPVHTEIGSKDFLSSISDLIQAKDTDSQVKQKAKECMQSWAVKFADKRDVLPNYTSVYSLLEKNTVKLEGKEQQGTERAEASKPVSVSAHMHGPSVVIPKKLSETKAHKLKSDLSFVQENINLTNEIIDAADPGMHVKSNDLLTELVGTLRAMKAKLIKLIANLQEEDLMKLSRSIKDQLEYTLDKYNQLIRGIRPRLRNPILNQKFEEIKSPLLDPILFDSPVPVVPPVKSKPAVENVFEYERQSGKSNLQDFWNAPTNQSELSSSGLFQQPSPMPSQQIPQDLCIQPPSSNELSSRLLQQPFSAPLPIFNQGVDLIAAITSQSSTGYPQTFSQPSTSYPNLHVPSSSSSQDSSISAHQFSSSSSSLSQGFSTDQPKENQDMKKPTS